MSYGTLISTQTVGAAGAASINFVSIPQTYTDLILVYSARGTNASTYIDTWVRFNGSSTGYLARMLYTTNGTTAQSATDSSGAQISWGSSTAANAPASTFSNGSIYIPNYTGLNVKTMMMDVAFDNNATAGGIQLIGGNWSTTSAITQVSLIASTGTFVQYSSASLYGVNPIVTSTGTTPTVDYLVVAGGGGGGYNIGGGGGAGGLLTGTGFTVTSGTALTVTVGGGGAGGTSGVGTNGVGSAFSTISTTGGGGGGGPYNSSNAATGGSGGGGQANTSGAAGAVGTVGQGYAGGSGSSNGTNWSAGGGGGSAFVGTNASYNSGTSTLTAGNGGDGSLLTLNGFSQYYAGGGGGSAFAATNLTGGTGGMGGGGQGALTSGTPTVSSTVGQINTGGGGGGGSYTTAGSAGGSGVVILRYPQTYAPAMYTTGNPEINYVNGYRVYTWYASGSVTFGVSTPLSVISSGLILNLDAGYTGSYPGYGTVWKDLSGNAYDGTLLNGTAFSTLGIGSMSFDGVDDYVSGPIPSTATSNVTLQGWVNVQAGRKGPFFRIGSNNGGYSIGQGAGSYGSTGQEIIMLFSGARWIGTGVNWDTGWQMVTMVLDASGVPTAYKNGTVIGTYSGGGPIAPTTNYILGRTIGDEPGGGGPWTGNLGTFWMYNRALSSTEITANFNATKSRYGL
jgi:hypothetical protein